MGATGVDRWWRRLRLRTWLLLASVTLLAALLAVVTGTSLAWGSSLRETGRLLPGTTIAALDVGDATVDEAIAAVDAALAERLDRVVELQHGERSWSTSARDLGATTDVEQVVAQAFERTTQAGLLDLVRMRWTGTTTPLVLDVQVQVPAATGEAFVAAIAEELDRDPRDARVAWEDGALALTEDRAGRLVERDDAVTALLAALEGDGTQVALPVTRLEPAVTTAVAQRAVDVVGPVVDAALDRTVTAALGGRTWSTSPRTLGATPDVAPLLAAALADGTEPAAADVALEIPDGAVTDLVARIAAEVDQPARDAQVDWSSGRIRLTGERDGVALDRDAARTAIRDALAGGASQVQLRQVTVRPRITSGSFERVLLVNQAERRVYLYEGDEVVRSWPVAVGLAGSPTPTGVFTVGAKRFEPTWYNPSPNGWGADMPARVGPGPDNPLGVRALNWHRDGRDTLIRFHGTPNEASIGEAASRGCVRMFNADVIELYDLVPVGTTIVSVAG